MIIYKSILFSVVVALFQVGCGSKSEPSKTLDLTNVRNEMVWTDHTKNRIEALISGREAVPLYNNLNVPAADFGVTSVKTLKSADGAVEIICKKSRIPFNEFYCNVRLTYGPLPAKTTIVSEQAPDAVGFLDAVNSRFFYDVLLVPETRLDTDSTMKKLATPLSHFKITCTKNRDFNCQVAVNIQFRGDQW